MIYENIRENKRDLGKTQYYFDPLHKQIVGFVTKEVFRKTIPQIRVEVATLTERTVAQTALKEEMQGILAGYREGTE